MLTLLSEIVAGMRDDGSVPPVVSRAFVGGPAGGEHHLMYAHDTEAVCRDGAGQVLYRLAPDGRMVLADETGPDADEPAVVF